MAAGGHRRDRRHPGATSSASPLPWALAKAERADAPPEVIDAIRAAWRAADVHLTEHPMNLSTRVTFSNVFADASGAEAVVEVGYATYSVHFVNSEIRAHLVSGSPRGAEKKAWPAHAARVAADRWALTDAWKAEHAAIYAA